MTTKPKKKATKKRAPKCEHHCAHCCQQSVPHGCGYNDADVPPFTHLSTRAPKKFVCSMCGEGFRTDGKLWAHQTTFGHGGQQ